MKEAVESTEITIHFFQPTRSHIPEGSNLQYFREPPGSISFSTRLWSARLITKKLSVPDLNRALRPRTKCLRYSRGERQYTRLMAGQWTGWSDRTRWYAWRVPTHKWHAFSAILCSPQNKLVMDRYSSGYFTSPAIRTSIKLSTGAVEGWKRSVGPIMWEMKTCYLESMSRGISYMK